MSIKEHKVIEEIKLDLPSKKPDEETVKMISDLLKWAEDRDIQSVIVIGKKADGVFISAYSDNFTIKDLIYGTYLLDSRIKEWLTYSNLE